MWGRLNPLQTDTANESKDKPIARKKTVKISIRTKLSDKTIKKMLPAKCESVHQAVTELKVQKSLLKSVFCHFKN